MEVSLNLLNKYVFFQHRYFSQSYIIEQEKSISHIPSCIVWLPVANSSVKLIYRSNSSVCPPRSISNVESKDFCAIVQHVPFSSRVKPTSHFEKAQ